MTWILTAPAAAGKRRWPALVPMGAIVLGAICSSAGTERPAVTTLLNTLNLRGYPSGATPPPLSGHTFETQSVSLADLRGKVILLNFWASWCLECRPEMPLLEHLYREFAPRGLAVVGINAREDGETVRRYAKALGLTFPLVLDTAGEINAVYGVVGLPTTFLVGRDGRAVALAVGPREWASIPGRAIIETLLAEPIPRPSVP
jgi:peroxiredoxin